MEIEILTAVVNKQVLTITKSHTFVADTQNIYTASFAFDAEWDGFAKTVIFRSENNIRFALLDNENKCILPPDVIEARYLEIGIQGNKDGQIITTKKADKVSISESGGSISMVPAPFEQSEFDKLMDELAKTRTFVNEQTQEINKIANEVNDNKLATDDNVEKTKEQVELAKQEVELATNEADKAKERAESATQQANNAANSASEAEESANNAAQAVIAANQAAEMAANEVKKAADEVNKAASQASAAELAANNANASAIDAQSHKLAALQAAEDAQQSAVDAAASLAQISSQADGIVLSVTDTIIVVDDASNKPLQSLTLYGKSTQESTNGYQLFDASKLPSITANGFTVTNNGDGSFTITGEGNSTISSTIITHIYSHEESVKLIKTGALTLTVETVSNPACVVRIKTTNRSYFLVTAILTEPSIEITDDILNDENFKISIYFYYENAYAVNSNKTIRPMLYQDGDGTWEPFTGGKPSPNSEYPQEIESVENPIVAIYGANLLSTSIWNLSNAISQDDGTVISNIVNSYYSYFSTANTDMLQNGKTYKFFVDGLAPDRYLVIVVYGKRTDNSTYQQIIGGVGVKELFITLENFTSIASIELRFNRYTSPFTDTTTVFSNFYFGVVDTNYQPYVASQSVTFPYTLRGIPVSSGGNYTDADGQQWICDTIEVNADGSGKLVQRCVEIVLTNSATISVYNVTTSNGTGTGFVFENIMPESTICRFGFCNMGIVKTTNSYIFDCIWIGQNNKSVYVPNSSFYDNTLEDKGLANFKAFLAENPLKIVTYVDTPIEIELTTEEIQAFLALHTNKPYTTIFNNQNGDMTIEYVADTKLYIDNKFAELQNAILSTGGNV